MQFTRQLRALLLLPSAVARNVIATSGARRRLAHSVAGTADEPKFWQVCLQSAEDYITRRGPYRAAHIERAQQLRDAGMFVAGGPSKDGRTADLFLSGISERAVRDLVEQDPYWTGSVWVKYKLHPLAFFAPPLDRAVPVVLDGSRVLTLVESAAGDQSPALHFRNELPAAQQSGLVVFGGQRATGPLVVALAKDADLNTGLHWVSVASGISRSQLTTRWWIHVL